MKDRFIAFISNKVKEHYSDVKGNHMVASNNISSREYIIKVPFENCICAPVVKKPLSNWGLITKLVEENRLNGFPDMNVYIKQNPIFKSMGDIINDCRSSKMNLIYVFSKLLINIRLFIAMLAETDTNALLSDVVYLKKSKYMLAYCAVSSRSWGHNDKYWIVPVIDRLNNSFYGNCVTKFDDKNKQVVFQATRAIKPDQELTHTYSNQLFREKIYLIYNYIDNQFPTLNQARVHYDECKIIINNLVKDNAIVALCKFIKVMIENCDENRVAYFDDEKPVYFKDIGLFDYYMKYLFNDIQTNMVLDIASQSL